MIKLLKGKKGITLIEIIVGMFLLSMVVLTVSAVITPMMKTFTTANDFAEYNTLLDSVGNRIVSDMAQSSAITNLDPLTIVINSEAIVYTDTGGSLQRNGVPVFPEGFYRRKAIDFNVTGTPPGFIVEVTISPSGGFGTSGATITREYAVRPLLLRQYN